MKTKELLLILMMLTLGWMSNDCWAQDRAMRVRNKECPSYIFRVCLRDKQGSPYSLERPSRYLSRRSFERRSRQGLVLDSTDLPVTPRYVHEI